MRNFAYLCIGECGSPLAFDFFGLWGAFFLIPLKDQTVRLIYLYVNGENKRKIRENNRGAAHTVPLFFLVK